jgi:hypothetical protein
MVPPITASAKRFTSPTPMATVSNLYVDRDPAEWPRDAKGELEMTTAPLDLESKPACRALDHVAGGTLRNLCL